jgi:hypothetical protein
MTTRTLFVTGYLVFLAAATSGFPRKMGQPPATIVATEQNSAMRVARSEQAPVAIATSPPINIPSYPDTPQGLEKQMKDMVKLEKQGNQQELAPYAKSLLLPDADNWFK